MKKEMAEIIVEGDSKYERSLLDNASGNVLVAEASLSLGHFSAGVDIALRKRIDDKENVFFAYIAKELPYEVFSVRDNFLQCHQYQVFDQVAPFLRDNGVDVIDNYYVSESARSKCKEFSEDFIGSTEDLRKYKYDGYDLGLSVVSTFISVYKSSQFDISSHEEEVRKALYSSAIVFERVIRLIDNYNISCVFTQNGRNAIEYPVVAASKKLDVTVLRHESGRGDDYYAIYNGNIHDEQHRRKRIYSIWNTSHGNQETALLVDRVMEERMGYSGQKRKSEDVTKGLYRLGTSKYFHVNKNEYAVFFHSSEDEFEAIRNDYDGRGYWARQYDALVDVLEIVNNINGLDLVLRVHPRLSSMANKEKSKWDNLKLDGLHVVKSDDVINSYEMLMGAKIVLTYGSTMGIESTYLGRPTVLLNSFIDYADCNIAYQPKDLSELESTLLNYKTIRPMNKESTYPFLLHRVSSGIRRKYMLYRSDDLYSFREINVSQFNVLCMTAQYFKKIVLMLMSYLSLNP